MSQSWTLLACTAYKFGESPTVSHRETFQSGRREVTLDIKLVLFSRSAVNSKFIIFCKLFSLISSYSDLKAEPKTFIAREFAGQFLQLLI